MATAGLLRIGISVLLLLFCLPFSSQAQPLNSQVQRIFSRQNFWTASSSNDFTSSIFLRIPNSTSLPATCTEGDIYQDTNATSEFYLCTATNTWTVVGSSTITSGTTAIIGGNNTSICFNDSGVINCGDVGLTFTKGTGIVRIGNSGASSGILEFGNNAAYHWNITGDLGSRAFTFDLPGLSDGNINFAQGGTVVNKFGASADGSTSNQAGTNTLISGGRSSGTALGGAIVLQTTPAGASSATLNALVARLTIDSTGLSTFTGKIKATSTAPALSACGTDPSIVGSATAGKVTTGSGGTVQSCTLTFATAYTVAPACTVSNESTIVVTRATSTTTTLVIDTAVAGTLESDVVAYICIQGS